jgi:ABC-type multidrug transport system fused ATPase/permease subunit
VLILDEATSALDSISEALIKEALDRIMVWHSHCIAVVALTLQVNKTVLIIAHRLKTIEHADSIAVLEDGSVAELGTYAQLMAHNGVFATLVNKQQHQIHA